MVIDEADPDNYFIDFEINRLSGNQPSDYYNDPNGQATPYSEQNIPNQNMPDSYVNGAPVMNSNPQPVPTQPQMPQQQYDSVTGQPIYPNMPK